MAAPCVAARVLGGMMTAGGGLAAAAIFGCSDDSSSPSSGIPSEGKPVSGGTLTRTAMFEIQGGQLDPHTIPTTWTQDYKLRYQTLLVQDPLTLDLNGQLAGAGRPLANFDVDKIGRKTVKGAGGRDRKAVRSALRLIESGYYPLEEMCTNSFPLDKTELALKTLGWEGEANPIHVSVVAG